MKNSAIKAWLESLHDKVLKRQEHEAVNVVMRLLEELPPDESSTKEEDEDRTPSFLGGAPRKDTRLASDAVTASVDRALGIAPAPMGRAGTFVKDGYGKRVLQTMTPTQAREQARREGRR